MSDWKQVVNIRGMLSGREGGLALLQCTSCYPSPPACINLNVIDKYRAAFPDVVIGYSGNVFYVLYCVPPPQSSSFSKFQDTKRDICQLLGE